jgi:phosphoribosyl-ATP pyrophosphohydrolase/phosphoribosyl-AMP cyclohydrolase
MLVPSIDIMDGKVVQLRQGKDLVLKLDMDPISLARDFNRYGEVAVIDLDAAMGNGDNINLIENICRVADVRVGGGIRDKARGQKLMQAGAKRLIFGTAATPELLGQFPADVVMVALDHRNGEVVDHGWQTGTGESLGNRALRLAPYCGSFLSTFVENEGCMVGLSISTVENLKACLNRPLTVAGGISSTEEVVAISRIGVDVQVGMALYTGKVDPVQAFVDSVKFGDGEPALVPTIVQDDTGRVLMLAYSSKESLKNALQEGRGIYYSRSRKELWEKGLTSGNIQRLVSCRLDCDRDTVLFTVVQKNGACHVGSRSCFDTSSISGRFAMEDLFKVLKERKDFLPAGSYSTTLFQNREKLLKKINEEAFEVVSHTSRENLCWEIADLIYFLSVLAVDEGIDWNDIRAELGSRRK